MSIVVDTMRRAFVSKIALVLLIVIACGACGAGTRTKTLRVNLVALNVARDTMRAVSKEREKQIVDACNPPSCTNTEGHARLDAWRAIVDKVAAAIDDGYTAIYGAAILDDLKSAGDAGTAVRKALALLKDMHPANTQAPATPTSSPAPPTTKEKP